MRQSELVVVLSAILFCTLCKAYTFTRSSGIYYCRLCHKKRDRHLPRASDSKLYESFEETEGENIEDEGKELAKQFYDQIRKRKLDGSYPATGQLNITKNDRVGTEDGIIPDESRQLDLKKSDSEEYSRTKTKFTGRQPFQPDMISDGSSGQGSLFQEKSTRRSPREQMIEREFNLVARAENAIPIQAAFAFCVLCFYLYVGFTGGIKTETDYSVDETDDYTQRVVPEPKDSETSYWL